VLLVALGAGTAASAANKRVLVLDNRFAPARVAIARGDVVTWLLPRRDRLTHNVTATKTPRGVGRRAFTSSRFLSPGAKFRRKFKRPGKYRFYCSLHPNLRLAVNVRRR